MAFHKKIFATVYIFFFHFLNFKSHPFVFVARVGLMNSSWRHPWNFYYICSILYMLNLSSPAVGVWIFPVLVHMLTALPPNYLLCWCNDDHVTVMTGSVQTLSVFFTPVLNASSAIYYIPQHGGGSYSIWKNQLHSSVSFHAMSRLLWIIYSPFVCLI